MYYETTNIEPREKRLLGRTIDEAARIGHQALNKAPTVSEKWRIKADLIGTMIRSKYKGNKYGGEMDKATEKALELDPDNPRIMHELARNYIRSGNNTRAVAMFGQLIRHEPDNELALFIVGLAAAERRDYELTVATLGRPLVSGQTFTHDPGSSVLAGYHLARALSGLGYDRAASRSMHTSLERIGDFNRRSRYRQQLDSIFRRQAEMWQFIGDAYFRILEYEEALQAYDAASRMTGANLNALVV